MICLQCNIENSASAKFCKSCGTSLKASIDTASSSNPKADRFIIIGISIGFVASCIQILIWNVLKLPSSNSWSNGDTTHYFQAIGIMNLVGGILIPLALKNSILKILGVLLVLIPGFYYIISS